jgi:hypothetical protein
MDTTPLVLASPEQVIRNRTEAAIAMAKFSAGGTLTVAVPSEDQARAYAVVLMWRVIKLVEVWRTREQEKLPVCPQPISVEVMGFISLLESMARHEVGQVAAAVEPLTPAGE